MILPPSLLSWPPEALDFYRERAAIREVQGRMPRARAEALAEEDVRAWFRAGGDEALLAALGAVPVSDSTLTYGGRPGSRSVARRGAASR